MSDRGAEITVQKMTRTADETRILARALAASLRLGDIIALEGELGAGKTCFVRGLAEGLGIDPAQVSSPTFVIAHEYEGPSATLAHVDAYRLKGAEDLESIGFSEMLRAGDAIIAIEWPSRIAAALPGRRIEVNMQIVGATNRLVRLTAPAELADRLARLDVAADDATQPRSTSCRTCRRPIDAALPTFPFCSDRCRMADLGDWFTGRYMMTRPATGDDELSE